MKLGFLGCGKMASALIGGVLKANIATPAEIGASDRYPQTIAAAVERFGILAFEGNGTLAEWADVLVLCVKPGDALAALQEAGAKLKGKLVISIVAGLPLQVLAEAAGPDVRLVRVMPNPPALIGEGAAAFSRSASATGEDAEVAARLFGAVGRAVEVPEPLLDAVTGLSGSGPAYVYLFIEALADGGVRAGLPRPLALELAAQTVVGAARMVLETETHPAVLKDQVTSPGGTTIAGLESLEADGLRGAVMKAVAVATQRSKELGQ